MEKINQEKFDELISGERVVFCDFYADWCMPCRMLAPVLEAMQEEFGDKATFVKVNVDDCPELVIRYGIRSIPYVGAFKGGELVGKSVGFGGKQEVREFIASHV